MTSKEVLRALCGLGTNCLWSPNRLVAVPNSNSLVGWEADLLLLHQSGWVWEVEIKVSVADFRREFKTKTTKHEILCAGSKQISGPGIRRPYLRTNKHVQKYFFALTRDVFDKVRDEVPEYAGIVVVDPGMCDRWGRPKPWIERKAKNLPCVGKAPESFRIELLRLAHARLWSAAYKDATLLDDPIEVPA